MFSYIRAKYGFGTNCNPGALDFHDEIREAVIQGVTCGKMRVVAAPSATPGLASPGLAAGTCNELLHPRHPSSDVRSAPFVCFMQCTLGTRLEESVVEHGELLWKSFTEMGCQHPGRTGEILSKRCKANSQTLVLKTMRWMRSGMMSCLLRVGKTSSHIASVCNALMSRSILVRNDHMDRGF